MRIGSLRDEYILPTRQYVFGSLGGFGLGMVFGSYFSLSWQPEIVIPGFVLAAIASLCVRVDQFREGPEMNTRKICHPGEEG